MNGLITKENLISILIAGVTIFISNYFTYLFTLKKESKQLYDKYKIDILEKLYMPIYKILIGQIDFFDGYKGITGEQFGKINNIVLNNYTLVDPELDRIIWEVKEEIEMSGFSVGDIYNEKFLRLGIYFDKDKELVNHVKRQYNKLKKSIGLPYEKAVGLRKTCIKAQQKLRRFNRGFIGIIKHPVKSMCFLKRRITKRN